MNKVKQTHYYKFWIHDYPLLNNNWILSGTLAWTLNEVKLKWVLQKILPKIKLKL